MTTPNFFSASLPTATRINNGVPEVQTHMIEAATVEELVVMIRNEFATGKSDASIFSVIGIWFAEPRDMSLPWTKKQLKNMHPDFLKRDAGTVNTTTFEVSLRPLSSHVSQKQLCARR